MRERVVRVEVGPGLEGAIPDIVAARVIRNEMAPRFKDKDYAGGLGAGLDALMAAADGGGPGGAAQLVSRHRAGVRHA